MWEQLLDSLPYIFAGFIVAIHACHRYGTPSTNRASTTKAQFYLTGGLYVFCAIMLYAALDRLLAVPGFSKFLAFGSNGDLGLDAEMPRAFLAALLLTSLLPNIPMLNQVDRALLGFFQRLGSIPTAVRSLTKTLIDSDYSPPGKIRELIRSGKLVCVPKMLAKNLNFEAKQSPRATFTRDIALYAQIDSLRSGLQFSGFFQEYTDAFTALTMRVSDLSDQANVLFALPSRVSSDAASTHDALKTSFDKACAILYEDLCNFFARMLLHSSWSLDSLQRRLTELGFQQVQSPPKILRNSIISTGLFVFAAFTIGMTIYHGLDGKPPQHAVPRWVLIATVVAINHSVAALIAIAPKAHWSMTPGASMGPGERPIFTYLLAAVASGISAMVVIMASQFIWERDLYVVWEHYRLQYPWTFAPMISCFSIAMLCDSHFDSIFGPKHCRFVEGITLAAIMSVGGYIIWYWIGNIAAEAATRHPPFFPVLMATCIGMILGYNLPHAYRQMIASYRRSEQQQTALLPVDEAVAGMKGEGV